MSISVSEKRREERRPAEGGVRVRFADPQAIEIQGRLMDVSTSGFRMAHDYTPLTAGQVVQFSHVEASGEARAVWTRITAESVETGFFVVRPE